MDKLPFVAYYESSGKTYWKPPIAKDSSIGYLYADQLLEYVGRTDDLPFLLRVCKAAAESDCPVATAFLARIMSLALSARHKPVKTYPDKEID